MWKVFASNKVWWIAIGLAVALWVANQAEMTQVRRDIGTLEQKSFYPVKRDGRSVTGFQFEQRRELLTPDGYHWTMQTQRMLADGDLRVRRADYDNQPGGREVHWSSALRWWLGGLGWLWSLVGGSPLPVAVEEVAVWANPLLLLAAMGVLVPWLWRWAGGAAAAALVLGVVTVGAVGDLFAFAGPDHHGLVAVFGLLTVLFLLRGGGGFEPEGGIKSARRWFVASGVAGGAGLWVSSATQVPVLIGTGLGVVGGIWWFMRKAKPVKGQPVAVPGLWRWWGAAGGLSSLFFYLLEYFPSHFGMRLEVNHPLYAIAWFGAGELLFRTTRWMTGGGFAKPGADQAQALAAVAGLGLLPLVVLLAGDQTFWVGDRLLWSLHRDYIVEFCSVFRRLSDAEMSRWLFVFNPLPVLVLALGWLVFRSGCAAVEKARLAIVLVPAILFFALAVYQVRWAGIGGMLCLGVLVFVLRLLTRGEVKLALGRGGKILLGVLALLVVLPGALQTATTALSIARGKKGMSMMDLRLSVLRDLAWWLCARTGGAGGVVLGGPSATTSLIYHGGFKGLGTLYWENKDGLHAMVEIFSATKDETARQLIAEHGITHIVVVSWDSFAEESARLALGLRRGEAAPENTFIARLAKGQGCPFWLRPVYYPAPQMEALKGESVLVYEVVPEQSREEAALRFGQLQSDQGNVQHAGKFLSALVRHFPDFLPGWVALAQVQLAQEDAEGFRASHGRIQALQARGAVQTLALDDRIDLAAVLAAAGDADGMREQVRLCLEVADEATLRRLNINSLICLVLLAEGSGEAATHREIARLAGSLVPPDLLQQARASSGR